MKTEFNFMREVEERIKTRLSRAVLLDHLSITDLEKLHYLARHESNEYLSKTLNQLLDQQ